MVSFVESGFFLNDFGLGVGKSPNKGDDLLDVELELELLRSDVLEVLAEFVHELVSFAEQLDALPHLLLLFLLHLERVPPD